LKRVRFSEQVGQPENHWQRWLFRRIGSEDIEIFKAGDPPVAYFKANFYGGGKLSFPDGEEFQLIKKGLFRPVWSWRSVQNEKLLKVVPYEKSITVKDKSRVERLSSLKFSVLSMLSWHQILRSSKKARAMVATGTPAT
jgi:hypothetical protein